MKRKKTIMLLIFFIFYKNVSLFAADTLEVAIKKQADYIIRNSPRNAVLAIVNIDSGSKILSEYIIERLPDHIINAKEGIVLVDRKRLDLIQDEIWFQYSGEVSEETMVSIGKKTGARAIVSGSIMEIALAYNFNIKILDVESAKIVGSNSTQIIHDETMDAFMKNSQVAQNTMLEAQQKREEHEAAVTSVKNALGFFPRGTYFGYLWALSMPIGLSFGEITEGTGLFLDMAFSPPKYNGIGKQNDLTYKGNTVENQPANYSYKYEKENTSFIMDVMAGLNINIIKTLLWLNLGTGFEYKQDYKLFTEISVNDSNKAWIKSGSDKNFKFAISAGLLIKLWYFYFQGKYKYVVGEEFDTASFGFRHFSIGAGYVWRAKEILAAHN